MHWHALQTLMTSQGPDVNVWKRTESKSIYFPHKREAGENKARRGMLASYLKLRIPMGTDVFKHVADANSDVFFRLV